MQTTEDFPTVESQHRMVDPAKYDAMNRKQKRHIIRHRPGIMQAPGSARVRSGIRTGTTKHFKMWMADLAAHSALQRLNTSVLAESIEEPQAAGGMALLWIGGFRNVWSLSQAPVEKLLKVRGIGVKRLAAVEKYLRDRQVPLRWTTSD